MGEDLQTKQAGLAGKAKTPRKMKREDRLAEELRANLKRRKAGARREKDPSGEPASDESGT
jgi:hypothetical protein